jgi:hypothetical protein
MSVLTSSQLAEIRRAIIRKFGEPINMSKPRVNAAFQAIEDWFEANKAAGSAAIDAATAPDTFTGAQKKILFAVWLLQKYGRES